jgi:hypothetical protein
LHFSLRFFSNRGLFVLEDVHLLFKHKNEPKKIQIDLGDVEDKKEKLAGFLEQHLKVTVQSEKDKLAVDSEKITQTDVFVAVKKFVYHQGLNNTHYVSSEVSKVKINRLKGDKKKEKEKHKNGGVHQSEIQTWGL